MKRELRIGFILSLFCFANHVYAEDAKFYFGRWHIVEIADYAKISSISDAKANQKIGRDLIMSETSLTFDRHACKPKYEISTVDPEKDLEEGYRISNERLRLPSPVVLIDTRCEHGRYIYVVGSNQIIVEQAGVFYRANRVSNLRSKHATH